MNNPAMCQLPNAPGKQRWHRQRFDKPGVIGMAFILYMFGFALDWLWWIHYGDWAAVMFGWAPALLWPFHIISWVLFGWLPALVAP